MSGSEVAPVGATWHRGVDLVAVERALSGVPPIPGLTEEEQRYAVGVLAEAGVSDQVAAGRLGIAARTVTRWRSGVRGDD